LQFSDECVFEEGTRHFSGGDDRSVVERVLLLSNDGVDAMSKFVNQRRDISYFVRVVEHDVDELVFGAVGTERSSPFPLLGEDVYPTVLEEVSEDGSEFWI